MSAQYPEVDYLLASLRGSSLALASISQAAGRRLRFSQAQVQGTKYYQRGYTSAVRRPQASSAFFEGQHVTLQRAQAVFIQPLRGQELDAGFPAQGRQQLV